MANKLRRVSKGHLHFRHGTYAVTGIADGTYVYVRRLRGKDAVEVRREGFVTEAARVYPERRAAADPTQLRLL